jgi:hypothetical protein
MMRKDEVTVLEEFVDLGDHASFCFADDHGEDWRAGYLSQERALVLFDQNPELHKAMREAARGFLWSLSTSRPE